MAAIVVLGLFLLGQLVFTLIGLLGFGLGGGSGPEIGLFGVVAVGALLALLWLLTAVIGRRVRPATALFALVAPVLDVALAVLILSGSLRPACTEQELAIIAEVPTFAGAEMTFEHESSSGACSGSLDVTATADEVVAHYRNELEGGGWTVAIDDVPTEAPEGEVVDARELRAERDGAVFTIALESWSGRTSAAIRVDASAAQAA
ncbi:MAG TPA: hypothetical protein VFI59_06835 [Actinomycetota bacterium]|nr:hypothetical protein [Actinomycetota bacterium]